MDELVIPIARRRMWVAVIAIGVFLLIPLSLLVIAVVHVLTSEPISVVMVVGLSIFGVGLGVPVGFMLARALRNLRSAGLRLRCDGYEFNGAKLAWTDVREIRAVVDGESGQVSHLKVICTPDAYGGRVSRLSFVRGALGLRAVPTYLQVNAFDTGDVPLADILRAWQRGDRSPGRRVDIEARDVPARYLQATVIPLKQGPALAASLALALLFLFLVAVGVVLLATRDYSDPVMIYLAAASGLLIFGSAAGVGYFTYRSVRQLQSPGLLFDGNGFQFGEHTWRWANIDGFETVEYGTGEQITRRIRVIYRPDCTDAGGPADTPLDPARFDTGSAHLEQILRERSRRSGESQRSVN